MALGQAALALAALALAACSTPAPTPEEFAAVLPQEREPGAGDRERVRRETERARLDLLAGRYVPARDRARKVLRIDPRAARGRAVLGRALAGLAWATDPPDLALAQKAEGHLLLAIRLDPDEADARLFYAQLLILAGHLSRAASELDKLLERYPRHQTGLRTAAGIRYELREERAASVLLTRFLAEVPGDGQALYRLGQCRLQLAEAHLRGDSELPPDQKPAAAAVATFRSAAQAFARYQKTKPEDADGYVCEAHARYRALVAGGKKQPARQSTAMEIVELFRKARRLAPKNPASLHGEGVVFQHLEQPETASRLYNEALLIDADYAPSLLNLAALLHGAGAEDQARSLWRRALDLDITTQEKRQIKKLLK